MLPCLADRKRVQPRETRPERSPGSAAQCTLKEPRPRRWADAADAMLPPRVDIENTQRSLKEARLAQMLGILVITVAIWQRGDQAQAKEKKMLAIGAGPEGRRGRQGGKTEARLNRSRGTLEDRLLGNIKGNIPETSYRAWPGLAVRWAKHGAEAGPWARPLGQREATRQALTPGTRAVSHSHCLGDLRGREGGVHELKNLRSTTAQSSAAGCRSYVNVDRREAGGKTTRCQTTLTVYRRLEGRALGWPGVA